MPDRVLFRLVFGLKAGHETAPDLLTKGENCFGVVVRAAAACLGLSPTADVPRRGLHAVVFVMAFVPDHRHEHKVVSAEIYAWDTLMTISARILAR